jgi:hypothetical protein
MAIENDLRRTINFRIATIKNLISKCPCVHSQSTINLCRYAPLTFDACALPVNCLTKNIPRPSSTLFALLIPITLLGRGLIPILPPPVVPNCFVGLTLRVGLSPPPVNCLRRPGSPPKPVNCLAIVVPVYCDTNFPEPV